MPLIKYPEKDIACVNKFAIKHYLSMSNLFGQWKIAMWTKMQKISSIMIK